MGDFDATVIVGQLDSKELISSIDKLVSDVADRSQLMANKFEGAMEKMKSAMKDFAVTQKVSVDVMKESWRQMSSSFDAMVAAQSNATGSGRKPTNNVSGGMSITETKNNITAIEAEIKKLEEERQKFISIREEIGRIASSLSANKKDLALIQKGANVYGFDEFGNKVLLTAEKVKGKIKELEDSLKRLMAERTKIPAPTDENLRKYDELQRKLAQLKESLNKAQSPKTVGDLEKQISAEQQYRKEVELGTQELRNQNQLIAEKKKQLKEELMTLEERAKAIEKQKAAEQRQLAKEEKRLKAPYIARFDEAKGMNVNGLTSAVDKLNKLQRAINDIKNSHLFSRTEINKFQREIDKLQIKIAKLRPKSMTEVLGMNEKGIDAITAKMRALRQVKIDPNDAKQVSQLSDEYARLKRRLAELQGQSIQSTHANNYLAQSFGYIRNRIVYALTLGAITSFTKQIYEIRGQYELLERSLGVLVNSFERGSQIFQKLNNMAIESPFTLMELAGAAKQLTAYNFSAKEVVETTRRLADLSSALGVPMERLTYNLGQIRAQTVLTARDARDFANAGLPIVSALAEHFTELEGRIVTTGDVYDRMSKKMVSYNDVMSVLNKMTDEGGKFFEFQAKQAETLKVQMNNLTLAWNNFLNEMGASHQGLLSVFPTALKALLQNWKAIDRVLWSIGITFIAWKGLQMVAVKQQWELAKATGATAQQMGKLSNGFKKFWDATKAMAANPWTWIFVGISAITDLVMQIREARKATHELNQEIKENASEASESMLKFLNNQGNKSTFALAKQNKLTSEQGEKAWEAIKEQLEQSAISANSLLSTLMKYPDVNERVAKGFEYAESIQKAQAALQDLKDDTIEVSSDFGWWGMFGEGLASDLKDFANAIEVTSAIINSRSWWNKDQKDNALINILDGGDVKTQREEFLSELEVTAESINNFLSIHKIKDPLQMREILERAKVTIKSKNPEIKGELAKIFDIELDKLMAEKTGGALDKNASLWGMFMERMKHNYSSAFQDINDDWVKNNKELTKEQKKAVDENLKYFKDSMPFAYDAVKEMVADASKLKIQIGLTFSTGSPTDFQRETNKRIEEALKGNKLLDFGSKSLLPNNNEDLDKWVTRLQGDIKNLKEENTKYKRDDTEWSKKQISDNETQINQRKNLLDLYNQLYEKEKKNKGRNKDEILDALKNEIELIKKAQSEYETLTKKGSSSTDALASAQSKFGKTLTLLNSKLSHWGLPTIDLSKIIKGDPNKTLAFFEKVKKALETKGLSNIERMKAVEVVIDEFDLKAKTFNLDNITKGLNDALSKLKEKYELSVELDANPKLGKFFADMLGLDIDTLPRTINAYEKEYTRLLNDFFKAKNVNLELPHLDLTNDDLKAFEEMKKEGVISEEAYNEINKAVKEFRDTKKKDFEETRKEYEALIKKYGEYEAKIEEVRNTSDKERLAFAKKFGKTDDTDKAIRLITDIQAVDDPAKKAELRQQLASLVQEIAQGDDTKIRLQTSIDMKGLQEEARINFEEYQKTPEWVLATGNISDLTHNALSKLIADLEQYKKKAKYLDDKQIKKINNALISLHKQIRKDNPFLAMGDSMDEARERMSLFQPELDTIMKQIIDLEKEIGDGEGTDKQLKKLADLKKRWGEVYDQQQAYGKVAATTIVKNINNAISVAKQASSAFNEMAEALGGKGMTEAAQTIKDVTGILEKGGEGAAAGAQIGGGYGAIIGAAAGVLQGVVTTFADRWSGNAKITEKIVESQREVKKLTLLYKQLENAIDDAYGQGEIRANQLLIANKKLQLAELETQLELEKSRKSKNRDDDKILELQGQVNDAKQELKELAEDITENFLNISSVKDAVSSMIDGIITALKNGENAMDSFTDSWEEMCWNMIKQVISTEILAPKFKKIFDEINEEVSKRGEKASDDIVKAKEDYENNKEYVQKWSDWYVRKGDEFKRAMNYYDLQKLRKEGWVDSSFDEWDAAQQRHIKDLEDAYTEATSWTLDDVERYAELLKSMQGDYEAAEEATREAAERLGLRMGDKAGNLSALQAGIQGITEDTAGAIEAYLNIVSQRMFYHGTILEQIRDTLVGFDLDLSLGVQSQMLLQLQNSYQTQMAIQNLLEGTLTPNGRAFMVELNS